MTNEERIEELESKCFDRKGRYSYTGMTDKELVEYIDLHDTWDISEDHFGSTPYSILNYNYEELAEMYTKMEVDEDFSTMDVWVEKAKELVNR